MLFGLPKRSFRHANCPRRVVFERVWCRLTPATNLPPAEVDQFFAEAIKSKYTESILLSRQDLLATVAIDDDGLMRFGYELTEHCPGDWAEFTLLSEIGEPYVPLFNKWRPVVETVTFDYVPWVAERFTPDFLT